MPLAHQDDIPALAVAIATNYTNFDTLGIDETNGDRLLMLMDKPEADRLAQFRGELAQIRSDFNA